MINYVWLALIVIAILFAGFNDCSNKPLKETPDPEVILAVPFDEEVGTFPFQQAPVELPGEDTVREVPVLQYDFLQSDEYSIKFPLRLDVRRNFQREREGASAPVNLTGSNMRILVLGDGKGARLLAHFENEEGQRFVAQATRLIDWEGEWRHLSIPFDRVVTHADNPAAPVAFPMTLTALELRQPPIADPMEGSILLGAIDIQFPQASMVPSSVDSNSWMGVITKSSAHWAGVSITLAIQLIGIMMLWLGLMRIAEKAGLVRFIAKCLKPIMVRLFPELPPESDAMGAIVMNISANMLGLGNAATPLGLKAMQELQELNERKEYASNAMCMLLALNTSSVTLITPAIIGFRVAAGSGNIMQFWPVMIGVTVCSTVAGVTACKILEKLPIYRIPPPEPGELVNEEVKA